MFTEPQQGASYEDLLAVALEAETLGFDGFFRSDHYLRMGSEVATGPALPGPTDAWITLAGLARETSRIRLGVLVSAGTFRLPGPLAVAVAQIDAMSGGRVEFGLGTGWFEAEHVAYGVPFPALKERFERLEEQLAIVTGLWDAPVGERFSYSGRHYQLSESPALPKPVQRPHPPVIIGGKGARRTPALAARFAAEANVPFSSLAEFAEAISRQREACEAIGRDPESLRRSATLIVCCGKDEGEFRSRAANLEREPDELRMNGAAGTADEVTARLLAYRDAGAQRVLLQVLDLDDLDHLRLLATEVLPQLV